MHPLVKKLASIRSPYNKFVPRLDRVQGYSEEEIKLIEQKHNICVHGQFKELLLAMGKCSGGILFEDLNIYGEPSSNETCYGLKYQKMIQKEDDEGFMALVNHVDLVEKQYIDIGVCSETVFFFMFTADKDDIVYYHDTNCDQVKAFGTLFEYLEWYRGSLRSKMYGDEYPELFDSVTTGVLL